MRGPTMPRRKAEIASARSLIESTIGKQSLDLYLHMYRVLEDANPQINTDATEFIRTVMTKFRTRTRETLYALKKAGYINDAATYREIIGAWDSWQSLLREKVDESFAMKRALAGFHMFRIPGQKKRFINAPLSVLIYVLSEDMKQKNPAFTIPTIIADFISDETEEQLTYNEITSKQRSMNIKSAVRILHAHRLVSDQPLFPAALCDGYTGCLKDLIRLF
jgi:hypothetical protein